MTRMVNCVVLKPRQKDLTMRRIRRTRQRIYDNVSKEAWQRWLGHQTILINEYRLTPIEPEAREFLAKEMEKFFFGGGSTVPEEFVPE